MIFSTNELQTQIQLYSYFFFFCRVVAPMRGLALAQGLAGLTPGPALGGAVKIFWWSC
jgi:hypothetical protein